MSFVNYMEITTLTLVQYCEQIASGMKFLASKGVTANKSKIYMPSADHVWEYLNVSYSTFLDHSWRPGRTECTRFREQRR